MQLYPTDISGRSGRWKKRQIEYSTGNIESIIEGNANNKGEIELVLRAIWRDNDDDDDPVGFHPTNKIPKKRLNTSISSS